MNGSINFDGTLSGSIAGGGGGGGSEVTITPVLTEGTKIADYSIDGASGELYAPEAGDTVEVTPTLNIGDKVADIEINGVNKALYSQSYSYANDMHDNNYETIGGLQKGENITPIKVKAVSYSDQSGAGGETIGVLSVGDTDFTVKQKKSNIINYSLTEQDTELLWYDGRHIYQKTFEISITSTTVNISTSDLDIDIMISVVGVSVGAANQICVPYYQTPNYYQCVGYDKGNNNIVVISGNNVASYYGTSYITIRYVKGVA